MKKLMQWSICMLMLPSYTIAQDEPESRNDKVESLKIAFITERLNLSSKEATVFWPVFNEFSDQMKKIREKEKENIRLFNARTAATEQESDKFLTEQLALKQAELDLTKKYVGEFRKVLPVKKVARLLTLEQEFKQQLLQRLKQRQGKMR